MGGEWLTSRIGDLGKVVTGKTPSTTSPDNFGGDYPFITIPDLDGRRDIDTSVRTLSEKGANLLRSCLLPKGAVMMSCIATIGRCGITTRPSFTNQQINSVICNNDVDQQFLYYGFTQLGHALEAAGGGGSIYTNVSKSRFSDIEVSLPPLPEQQAIACILGALDDKIELNRRMNETLEAMARAIFKSWFVDFDPVRAKAAGQSPPGLKPEIAALFPDAFEDSELGQIPRGWRVSQLVDICKSIFSGGTPSTQNQAFWGGNIPWLSSGETRDSFIIVTEKAITNLGVEGSSTRLAKSGTTVIASAGQGSTRGQTSLLMLDSYVNQSIVAIEANDDHIASRYLFFDLERRYEQFRQLSDSHSSRGSLTTKLLAGIKVVVPPRWLVSRAEEVLISYVERICCSLHESRTLAAIRDALLPKLISGELRVPDAERIVGRCL